MPEHEGEGCCSCHISAPCGWCVSQPPEDEGICGLCGEPGADKIPHPVYWPDEKRPDSELVHSECEQEECERAHAEFFAKVGKTGVDAFLRSL